ncbi:MAG: oligosaccharide flippase family protein [Desulfovibrio sp.]|jgi:O-antigen/teichoic acid export membrane protein|nr:oligosaccharide flippase family protein [Desulfovibrio sp.]
MKKYTSACSAAGPERDAGAAAGPESAAGSAAASTGGPEREAYAASATADPPEQGICTISATTAAPEVDGCAASAGGPEQGSGAPCFGASSFLKPLSRRFGFMVCAQWGSGLLSGVFMILLARSGPETFGLFTLAAALGMLVAMVTGAGFDSYLVPLLSENRADKRGILLHTLRIQLRLMFLSLALLAFLCFCLGYGLEKTRVILIVAGGMGPLSASQSFFALCRVQGRQDTEMRIRVPAAFAGSLFGIGALLLDAPLPVTACFKLAEASVVFLCIAPLLRRRSGIYAPRTGTRHPRGRDAMIFAGIAVCGLLYNKLNMYMLDYGSGAYALGLYNAPWELVDGLSILISGALIEKVMFPLMAGQWNKDRASFMRLNNFSVKCLLLLGLVSGYPLFTEGDRILDLIYGQTYLEAAGLLRAQLPCITASFLHNLAVCMLLSMGLHRQVFVVYLAGLALNIALCAMLIPAQEAWGAAWAISGTKTFMAACTVGLAMRRGLEFRPAHLCGAAAAVLAALGVHSFCLPILPREAAELLGFLPLLVPAALWLPHMFVKDQGANGRGDTHE